MKCNRYLLGLALLVVGTMPVFSQVSNDNEDEVYKIDARAAKNDFVPGQVLVKFKDESPMNVNKSRGKFRSAGNSAVDAVLNEFGVETMDKVLPNAKPLQSRRKARAYNGQIIEEKDLSQLYTVKMKSLRKDSTMMLVNKLCELGEVEFAEPNYKLYLMDTHIADDYSNNGFASQQWYLDDYGVKQLWNKPIINNDRPVIAIIDTGVDLTHPDLVDNLWTNTIEAEGEGGYDNDGNGFVGDVHGWDFVNNTGNVRDNNMHGTHVAGIAAASNNGIGIVGANPQALIMPVTVLQSDGTGDVATIIKGIDYAVANGATILNLSLGSIINSHALRQVLEIAYQSAIIVAAAGNCGAPITTNCGNKEAKPFFPAAYSFVLGVMATKEDGTRADFSNYDCDGPNYSFISSPQDPDGFNYELQAPGVNILSTIPGGKYSPLNGTSMATPIVAGAISALKMVKHYDSQEILWGDLTHTNNIEEAYNLTARPADLELIKVQIKERKELENETEEDYSGDGEIDAGEIVSIYPVLRTTFGPANNIKMHLEMGEYESMDVVQILSGTVDFGVNLSSYGKGVSLNPLQIKVPNGIVDGRHIRLKLVATCDDINDAFEKEFVLIVNNMVKISGIIGEDRTLTADHAYYVNESIAIPEGVMLTIEPGTRLEFAGGTNIVSFGKLKAKGTPEKPIIFTGHQGTIWNGILSHDSEGKREYDGCIYTNKEQSLFTLLPTEATPDRICSFTQYICYRNNEEDPSKNYRLEDYVKDFTNDMTGKEHELTDPNYLTQAVLTMKSDWEAYWSQYPTMNSEGMEWASVTANFFSWFIYENPIDTLSYCQLDNYDPNPYSSFPIMKDCVLMTDGGNTNLVFHDLQGTRNTITGINRDTEISMNQKLTYCNIVNNTFNTQNSSGKAWSLPRYSMLSNNNYFNNFAWSTEEGKYYMKKYWLANASTKPSVDKSNNPSYLGTSREDLVRPNIYEYGNAPNTFGSIDLSNMPTHPYAEAHGIVWKVCVNDKDAQDEFEDLAPLGVGKHKFEVYFNRPMNKAVAPQITFGVRDPYTQNVVDEDGSWNTDGTIYTAYKTITGKTMSDGTNRIYVQGAEDNEFFECPYEKDRFNVIINAAGSMATGFTADAGMGCVNLTWNNSNNDFEDAMGFNVYRYGEPYEKQVYNPHYDDEGNYVEYETVLAADTICLNSVILDIETSQYSDYDVLPRETYYYYYKVLSTDLQEYDVSNVVSATPLTSTRGDANGSGDVDVADVITTVNYAAGMNPKPFIFEAADMNTDKMIDILDIVGIIQGILNPSLLARAMAKTAEAVYTIEDGTLYVDSSVALAGVQVQLATADGQEITVAEDLDGFEHTSAWLSDNDYLFLAYNLNGKTLPAGKHALLHIGDAEVAAIKLADAIGHNVTVVSGNGGEPTGIDRMGKDVMTVKGVYSINGQKMAGSLEQMKKLPKGVYIIDGQKVVK